MQEHSLQTSMLTWQVLLTPVRVGSCVSQIPSFAQASAVFMNSVLSHLRLGSFTRRDELNFASHGRSPAVITEGHPCSAATTGGHNLVQFLRPDGYRESAATASSKISTTVLNFLRLMEVLYATGLLKPSTSPSPNQSDDQEAVAVSGTLAAPGRSLTPTTATTKSTYISHRLSPQISMNPRVTDVVAL